MNQKEISELKRRFRLGKNAIGRIYGCYVNSQKEIVSYLANRINECLSKSLFNISRYAE